jgi:hypothetical protein
VKGTLQIRMTHKWEIKAGERVPGVIFKHLCGRDDVKYVINFELVL